MLQNILNYDYLWIRLRVKGGAYGCMSGFGRDGDCYMVSYLDPKLAETNEVYDKLPEYLEQFDQDERSMDRYVIGAISEMDIPKNPAALGVRGLTAYLSGITREQLTFYNGTIIVVCYTGKEIKYGKTEKIRLYCTDRTSKRGKVHVDESSDWTKDCDHIKKASDNEKSDPHRLYR